MKAKQLKATRCYPKDSFKLLASLKFKHEGGLKVKPCGSEVYGNFGITGYQRTNRLNTCLKTLIIIFEYAIQRSIS